MQEDSQTPLLEIEFDHHTVVSGNRPGLEKLRESITDLLNNGGESVLMNDGEIEIIVFDEKEIEAPLDQSWSARMFRIVAPTIVMGVLLLILFATLFGFYHLFKLFI